MADQSAKSQLDILDEQAEKESGGGGFIAQFRFEAGYKAFVPGLGNKESFFAYTPGNEAEQAAAKAKCAAIYAAHSITDKNPQATAQLVVYKASVKGRDVKWKDDRFFSYPVWTQAYKEILKPALVACGINAVGEYWGRISFKADPSGRKKKGTDGEMEVELVAYPAELFANEAAAIAAAATHGGSTGKGTNDKTSAPAGYTPESWKKQADNIKKLYDGYVAKGMPVAAAFAQTASDYGVTPADISALVNPDHIPF
jgi:hypothetical protein